MNNHNDYEKNIMINQYTRMVAELLDIRTENEKLVLAATVTHVLSSLSVAKSSSEKIIAHVAYLFGRSRI